MHTQKPNWINPLPWLLLAAVSLTSPVQAHHTDSHFEERSEHQIVYQCNKSDPAYLANILFSVGELIRKYGDNVEVVVACFGPGLNLLNKGAVSPIPLETRQRASSLSEYGVAFHACENTMDALDWTEDDLVSYAEIVPIGVDDIMQLQEKGFSYFSW